MIILFCHYNNLNNNFSYLYNLFYYLKIKIKSFYDENDIYKYLLNNFDNNDNYIFYEYYHNDIFELLNLKYNKQIYYFINHKHHLEDLNKNFEYIHFILLSHNYKNLMNYNNPKILLNYQFDIDKNYKINDIENIIIYQNINNDVENFIIHKEIAYHHYNEELNYKNRIIIVDNIDNENIINDLILNNNLILIKNDDDLEHYFFYSLFIRYNNSNDLIDLIEKIFENKQEYFNQYESYIKYVKKKLLLSNKNFYQKLEEIDNINKDFGFIILRHIDSEETNKLWLHNILNIRKYYRNKIYIVDDNSDEKYINDGENELYRDVKIIYSAYKKRGEILPYYYFYINNWFKKCIILHDSVFINKYIDFNKYRDDIYYLWHFNHSYNNLEGENNMMKFLNHEDIIPKYDEKKWWGCFGGQTIISYDFLEKIQKKFKLFNLLKYIDNREKRMNFERIFSVLCSLLKSDLYDNKSIYGDIHDYMNWEYKYNQYLEDKKNNNVSHLELIKTWHGR